MCARALGLHDAEEVTPSVSVRSKCVFRFIAALHDGRGAAAGMRARPNEGLNEAFFFLATLQCFICGVHDTHNNNTQKSREFGHSGEKMYAPVAALYDLPVPHVLVLRDVQGGVEAQEVRDVALHVLVCHGHSLSRPQTLEQRPFLSHTHAQTDDLSLSVVVACEQEKREGGGGTVIRPNNWTSCVFLCLIFPIHRVFHNLFAPAALTKQENTMMKL